MSITALVLACIVIFVAAIVRGFSGFGFSLLAVSGLSLLYTPAQIVPAIFMLELAASLHLLPSIWREVHWKSLLPLSIGCILATPLGVYLLANVPARPMTLALALFVIVSTALLWAGLRFSRMPGPAASVGTGALSGLANGAFGIGGPPVVLFYLSTPAGNAVGRASLIAFFLLTDTVGLANLAVQDLVTRDSFIKALLFLPVLAAGIWVGARAFTAMDAQRFRKAVLLLLMLLSLATAAKALWG